MMMMILHSIRTLVHRRGRQLSRQAVLRQGRLDNGDTSCRCHDIVDDRRTDCRSNNRRGQSYKERRRRIKLAMLLWCGQTCVDNIFILYLKKTTTIILDKCSCN